MEETTKRRVCFDVSLGLNAGSTTKFVLLDEQEEILDSFYAPKMKEIHTKRFRKRP